MKLWGAESVSQLGTQVSLLALPLLAITVLDASTFQVGALAAVETAPFLLVGLPAGALVDRLPRRPILIAGDLGRAVLLLSIPVAHHFDQLTIGQLYVVGFLTGVLTVFFDVAYQSYLPVLVERDQLVDGNGKLEISRSGAQIAGPGIGGALIDWLSAPIAVLVDAVSFAVSGLAIGAIQREEPRVEPSTERTPLRTEVAEGLRYVLHHPLLRSIAGSTGTFNLFGSMLGAVLVVYMVRVLEFRPGVIGLILSVGNLGFLLGALVAAPAARRFGVGPTIVLSSAMGAGELLIPLASGGGAAVLIIAAMVIIGICVPVYNINQVSLRQAITPDRLQGRMNATMRFMVWGTMPIGALLGGALGSAIGLRPTLWIAAVGASLAFLWVFFSPVRSLAEIPSGEELGDLSPGVGGVVSAVGGAGRVVDEPVVGLGVHGDGDVVEAP